MAIIRLIFISVNVLRSIVIGTIGPADARIVQYFVYIIYSDIISGFYVGQCQNLSNRINEHNSGETLSIKRGNTMANCLVTVAINKK
ncbi:GIY-YIG nuclease family protein [Chryseolinea sp. T2]|uniref:GIY-YIG nuclease family protein n=1 Tax=Chryseolinea sp. T2 TaxID=3129255 RepID=UPI003FCD6F10